MNLIINAPINSGCNFIEEAIKQKMEVPHVPLKIIFDQINNFNDNNFNITILIEPTIYLKNYLLLILPHDLHFSRYLTGTSQASITHKLENAIKEYINFYDNNKFNLIYLFDDFKNKIDQTILNLFDKLNLDENNYKNKTGSQSLRDDVINKKINFNNDIYNDQRYDSFPIEIKEQLNNINTKEMFIRYNSLKHKAETI